MRAVAFCPAHVTGFFKAEMQGTDFYRAGSMGAGFSIKDGVITKVRISKRGKKPQFKITTKGYETDKTDVSEFVLNEFLKLADFSDFHFDIQHEISIPVGYGLGSSSAVALSLAYALNDVMNTKLEPKRIGQIAHIAEINCKTGLGDVLASFHGGFEIRTKSGAPGIGELKKINMDGISIIMICFSPISTNKFLKERISQINGLGEKMVKKLIDINDYNEFQDMSLEFAEYVKVMTPRMRSVIESLSRINVKAGVALFGETIFTMIQRNREKEVLQVLKQFKDGIIINSELDNIGARLLN